MLTKRIWRLAAFVAILLFTLFGATCLVVFAVAIASNMGWLQVKPIEITAHAVVTAVLGVTGLVGIAIAFDKASRDNQAIRARFVFDLAQDFMRSDAERDFFYKLDYHDFKFDPDNFAQSNDELQLDRLLYKLSYVGKLLRDGLVDIDDLGSIRHIASRTLRNPEVLNYLRYLKEEQIPDHSSFSEAIYLFEKWFGRSDAAYPAIKRYLAKTPPAPFPKDMNAVAHPNPPTQ